MKPWETDETFLARWLTGELTSEELKAFEASPEYASYASTAQALQPFEVAPFDQEGALGELMTRIREKKNEAPKVIPLYRRWYVAAAAIVLVLVAFAWLRFFTESPQVERFAQNREQIALPDGSSIDLQAGSLVRYSEGDWQQDRKVYLEGEAFFEVEKGQRFDVRLKQGTVSVLGTSFLIQEGRDTLKVICFTGKVQVEAFGHRQILTAGERVLSIKNQTPDLAETALPQPVWLADNIRLQDVSLGVVMQQLEEIYGLRFEGEPDTSLRFNPIFPVQDLPTALSQIFGPFNLEYQLDSTRNVVIIQ